MPEITLEEDEVEWQKANGWMKWVNWIGKVLKGGKSRWKICVLG
jgi:hypothetical protein